jgi:endothelin-converting enzyme/putative endopeptidase
VKAYLAWALIRTSAANLPKRFEDESFAFFSKTLGGAKAPLPRWQRCVNATDNALGESLGRIFVDRYFPPKAKAATSDLINQVRASFKGRIADLTWMSAETKAKAVQKLAAIDENIGYPAKFRDLSGLLIRRDEALGNVRRAALFERQRNLAKIGRPVERGEWRMTTPTVNAFYSPPLNDINFPAGILQPPFFDPDLDPAINYGAIGMVIGHEITHGFDDQGSKYDAQGNLVDWWTPDDRKQFDTRTQCLVDQYGGYTADGEVKVNGKLTLGENTADNGGARIAYIGLKRYLSAQGAAHGAYSKPIDGLSAEQRFFVGFARLWCSNDRPEGRRLRAQTDPHSPSDFRVNGTVSNMPEFAQAFQCKPGDKMVRSDACQVW